MGCKVDKPGPRGFLRRPKDGNGSKRILLECAGRLPETVGGNSREACLKLLRWCNGPPLSLSIAGSAVRELAEDKPVECRDDAWKEYLERSGKTDVLMESEDRYRQDITNSILIFLKFIDESRMVATGSRRLFRRCVFSGNSRRLN